MNARSRLRTLGLFLLALLIFLPGLGWRDVVNSHEARVIQTARTMAASGWPWESPSASVPGVELGTVSGFKRLLPKEGLPPLSVNPWIIPVMNGSLRLQKPPIPYWCAAISIRLLGDTESAARLPSALLGAASVVLLSSLVRRLYGRRTGWFAGLAWLSLYFVYDENRKAMADPYLAFFALLAVWGCIAAKSPLVTAKLSANRGQKTFCLIAISYLAVGLGLMSKGPVVLLHVLAGVVAFHAAFGGRPAGRLWHHLVGLVLLAAVSLPWPLAVLNRLPMAGDLWWYESLGEFGENREKPRGPLFYLSAVLLLTLPWIAVWLPHAIGSVTRWWLAAKPCARRRQELFPLLWLVIIVGVLSFSHVKKNAYLLPILPAIATAIGLGFRHLLASLRPRAWTSVLRLMPGRAEPVAVSYASRSYLGSIWIVGSLLVVGVLVAVLMPFSQHWVEPFSTLGRTPPTALAITAFAMLGVSIGVFTAITSRVRRSSAWPMAQSLSFALLTGLFFQSVNAPNENPHSAKAACREALRLLAGGGRTIATEQISEEVAVYLPVNVASAVRTDSRFATRVLYLLDDADGIEARAHRQPSKPFNPIGWKIEGGRVTAVRQLPVPGNPGDVRWKLYELSVERTAIATSNPGPVAREDRLTSLLVARPLDGHVVVVR